MRVVRFTIVLRVRQMQRTRAELAKAIDMHFAGRMINSPNDYDVVISSYKQKMTIFVCMRLCSIQDNRFAYRKNVLPTSMHPSQAALIVSLAKPYLMKTAQIMDPFCGVGTLLIARTFSPGTRDMLQIPMEMQSLWVERMLRLPKQDQFYTQGFSLISDMTTNLILITDMPVRNRQTKAEMELFTRGFSTSRASGIRRNHSHVFK